jgi:choline-sulfatase
MNVVLLTVDCLRYDRCGFNGSDKDTTPALDELATEAVVFDNAIASGPRTAESVPGILSGRLSSETAYLSEPSYKALPGDAETLATWLSRAGYRTVATVSNPQLTARRNFDSGFDSFVNLRVPDGEVPVEGPDGEPSESTGTPRPLRNFGHRVLRTSREIPLPVDPGVVGTVGYRAVQKRRRWPTVDGETVISASIDRLPTESDGPFFAWTHLNDPHSPLHPDRVRAGGLFDGSDFQQFRADARRVRHELSPIRRFTDRAISLGASRPV